MTLGIITIPDRCMKSMTKLDLVTNPLDVMTTLSCHCELNDLGEQCAASFQTPYIDRETKRGAIRDLTNRDQVERGSGAD